MAQKALSYSEKYAFSENIWRILTLAGCKDSKHKKLISMMYPRYDIRNLPEMWVIRDCNIARKRDCDKIYVSTKIGQGTQCQCIFIWGQYVAPENTIS